MQTPLLNPEGSFSSAEGVPDLIPASSWTVQTLLVLALLFLYIGAMGYKGKGSSSSPGIYQYGEGYTNGPYGPINAPTTLSSPGSLGRPPQGMLRFLG